MADAVNTVVAMMDIPMNEDIYEGMHSHLTVEVRDFGSARRTMILRYWVNGTPYSAMVDWEEFIEAFDAMRTQMMPGDWDDALASLMGGGDD